MNSVNSYFIYLSIKNSVQAFGHLVKEEESGYSLELYADIKNSASLGTVKELEFTPEKEISFIFGEKKENCSEIKLQASYKTGVDDFNYFGNCIFLESGEVREVKIVILPSS